MCAFLTALAATSCAAGSSIRLTTGTVFRPPTPAEWPEGGRDASLALRAAPGQYVSGWIALRATDREKPARITRSSLRAPGGALIPAESIELFRVVSHSGEATCITSLTGGVAQTGPRCLRVTLGDPLDELVITNAEARKWLLKRDWRGFYLLLAAVHCPVAVPFLR